MTKLFRSLLVVAFAWVATVLSAQDIASIQKRMQERLGAIDQMKQAGLVGESKVGLLESRGAVSAEQSALVSAENADRTTVYTELGKRNNTSAEQVGRLRAKQIAERSAPGIWLEDETGRWYKK